MFRRQPARVDPASEGLAPRLEPWGCPLIQLRRNVCPQLESDQTSHLRTVKLEEEKMVAECNFTADTLVLFIHYY